MSQKRLKNWFKKPIIRYPLGVIFIILGVLGLFLPFLQGLLFLAIGLYLLGFRFPWLERQLKRFRQSSRPKPPNPASPKAPDSDEKSGFPHEKTRS